jgi:hypothetical protein
MRIKQFRAAMPAAQVIDFHCCSVPAVGLRSCRPRRPMMTSGQRVLRATAGFESPASNTVHLQHALNQRSGLCRSSSTVTFWGNGVLESSRQTWDLLDYIAVQFCVQ